MDDFPLEECLKELRFISKIIDNLNYECASREYTLDDDEMGLIFLCRDIADKLLRKYGKENGMD